MKIAINDATATQLAAFASINLGLDVHLRMGVDKIRAIMAQAGFSGTEIEVDEPAPTPAVATKDDAGKPRKMIRILIPTQNEPGGKEPVVVGVNGKVARIKRGEVVAVPEEYVHALTNANKVAFDRGPNGEPINPTLVPTHPFSILGTAA